MSYEQMLKEESELWGKDAQEKAAAMPPDWQVYRQVWWSAGVMSGGEIEQCLASVQPGMKVIELGCNSGWLTVALARRGADVTGFDLSAGAIEIANDYYESIKDIKWQT
ncbi:class I SAM-dependent methyltransferase [Chloroflexota bacterium]